MRRPETAEEIDRAAAEWVARADRSGLDDGSFAELEEWLAEDLRRRGAYLRAQAAWTLLDRGRALATSRDGFPPRRVSRFSPRQWTVSAGAFAATLVTLVLVTQPAEWPRTNAGEPYDAAVQEIRTTVGEIRRIPLPDGSLAAINTNSVIAVRFEPHRRRITLRKGEGWFQVAKDTSRPFVVEAGDIRIRAIGTAFSVRRRSFGADVLVSEGVVEAWVEGAELQKLTLAAGARAVILKGRQPQVAAAPQEVQRALAWREGEIALDGATLAEAIAEFNRHNTRKLEIIDQDLANERLVGLFDARDLEGFAQAVSVTSGATVRASSDRIILSRERQRR